MAIDTKQFKRKKVAFWFKPGERKVRRKKDYVNQSISYPRVGRQVNGHETVDGDITRGILRIIQVHVRYSPFPAARPQSNVHTHTHIHTHTQHTSAEQRDITSLFDTPRGVPFQYVHIVCCTSTRELHRAIISPLNQFFKSKKRILMLYLIFTRECIFFEILPFLLFIFAIYFVSVYKVLKPLYRL